MQTIRFRTPATLPPATLPPATLLLATLLLALSTIVTAQPAFVENRGQWDSRARYLARLPGIDAWIGDGGIVYDFHRDSIVESPRRPEGSLVGPTVRRRGHAIAMRFVGAAGVASASDRERVDGVHNYLLGNDPTRWARGARRYREVAIERLYEGIDARVLIDDGGLRYDLIVAPDADPASIAVAFDGALGVRVAENGELMIETAIGEVRHRGLEAYQMHGAVRSRVECGFTIRGDATVGFALGEYDRSRPLVIDPIVWSRYLGHDGESTPAALAVDSAGNVFVTGTVFSAGYPVTPGAYDVTYGDQVDVGTDVVVSRIDAGGTRLAWSTYLGADSTEWAGRIAVDRNGRACVVLLTLSPEFPTTPGAFDATFNNVIALDGVVLKLDATGSSLVYSTFLGGDGGEDGLNVALDPAGIALVSGTTSSVNFPTTAGVLQPTYGGGSSDGFAARIGNDGSLGFSTYIGGDLGDHATSIAIDSIGAFLVAGYTESADFPTTEGAVRTTRSGPQDAFVQRINPSATILIYSTYLGGTEHEGLAHIEVDAQGEAFVAGQTLSADFPVTEGAYQAQRGHVYIARINALGTRLRYASFLGALNDRVGEVALGRGGFFNLTGFTSSRAYPTTADAVSRTFGGGTNDAFVTVVRPSGATLAYSTYLGGSGSDQGHGIGLDVRGEVYVAGGTTSTNFPNTLPDSVHRGRTDFFITKIGRCFVEARAGADRTICLGDSVTIGAGASGGIPTYNYRWTANGAPLARDTAVMTVSPIVTTVYVVTVQDFVGCDDADTVMVTVNPAPLVDAGADTAICAGGSVRIGAAATSGTPPFTYAWLPATGLSSRTAAAPTARPDSTTTYAVTVRDAKGCTATDTITVTINRAPVLEPPGSYEICAGDSATLGVTIASGVGPFTYAWTPATGLSSASAASPRAAPAASTSYRVTVTDANGCSTTSAPMTVTVGSTLRTRIAITGSTRLCPGASVTLDAGAFAQYRWSNGATTRTIVVSAPGEYSVAITSASGCSGGSDTVRVVAGAAADASFTGPPTACPGALAEYPRAADSGATSQWRIEGDRGSIDASTSPAELVVRWLRPGTARVHLVVTSADGCVDSSSMEVTITEALAPRLAASRSTSLCAGESVELDAGAYASYLWSTGATTRTIVVGDAGSYWVDVLDASGCGGRSDTIAVSVRALPAPAITALGTEICAGDSAVLVAPPGFARYEWSNGATMQLIAVTDAGSYTVTVVDSFGCRGVSDPVAIVVHALPAPPVITQSGDTLIASDAAAWQWLRDDVAIDGATERRLVRTLAGVYSVEITDSNGCRSRASVTPVERRLAWLNSASAQLGDRFDLAFVMSPALRASDGVTGYTVRLRLDPRDLFAHAVRAPLSNPGIAMPSMTASADGLVELRYDGATAVTGDTLFRLELQGLSTAKPASVVALESVEARGVDVRIAGNGLVLLEGCDIGTFAVGKRVRITSARVDDAGDAIVVRYRAPAASEPVLLLLDAAGRERERVTLGAGTGEEQEARLGRPGSGYYLIELRDRLERSAVITVVRR